MSVAPDLREGALLVYERVVPRHSPIISQPDDFSEIRSKALRAVGTITLTQRDVEIPVIDDQTRAVVFTISEGRPRSKDPLPIREMIRHEVGPFDDRGAAIRHIDRGDQIDPPVPGVVRVHEHVDQSPFARSVHRRDTVDRRQHPRRRIEYAQATGGTVGDE